MANFFDNRVIPTPPTGSDPNRYNILGLKDVEPNLGVPAEDGQFLVSTTAGVRSWATPVPPAALKSIVNLRLSLSATSSVPNTDQLNSANIFIHPYGGNEISLYDSASTSWQVVIFSGVLTRSLAPASSPLTNYDVYAYNAGSVEVPDLKLSYLAWPGPLTPPARGNQDGILVRSGLPDQRLVGVVRTTIAGRSTYDLGGLIDGSDSINYPKLYLSNLYNVYDASARYFFGTSWDATIPVGGLGPPPTSVYAINPRIEWVQAAPTLATTYMDIYNNWGVLGSTQVIAYVGAGIDSTTYTGQGSQGETSGDNSTATTYWAQSLSEGLHAIYYLYTALGAPGSASKINEHPYHGIITTCKV